MQPSLPRALNRNRKCHKEQVTLSVSAGLFIARLCVSLHIWFILSLSFSAEVSSLLVHTQASSVATLVLPIHHFSDDVSNADEQQL